MNINNRMRANNFEKQNYISKPMIFRIIVKVLVCFLLIKLKFV